MSETERPYWCVSLKGSDEDLNLLASVNDVDWKIEQEDGNYYLVAPDFQQCLEAVDVWELADTLIPDIQLAAHVLFPYFKEVKRETVYAVLPNGDRKGYNFLSARVGIVLAARASITGGRTPYKEAFESIRSDPAVKEAAHYFTLRDRGWTFFLWKVYEIIQTDVAGHLSLARTKALGPQGKNWVSDDTYKRFRTAVHDPTASGDDARHAVYDHRQFPPHPDPMRESEAVSFIRLLLLKWTQWKHTNRSQAGP